MSRRPRPEVRLVEAPREIAGRLPPCDLDAEAFVLSASMLDTAALASVEDMLAPEDFYSAVNNAKIWEGMLELRRGGSPVDIGTLQTWLKDREQYERVGGFDYLSQLAHATPSVTPRNVIAYAETVLRKARRRRTIAAAQTIAAEGYGDVGDEDAWIAASARRMSEIAATANSGRAVLIGESLDETFRLLMEQREQRRGQMVGLSTGLVELDRWTSGLHGGVTLITGKTGEGKSALAQNIAFTVADNPRLITAADGSESYKWQGAALFSMEMPVDEVGLRMACAYGRVDSQRILSGEWSDQDWEKLVGAQVRLRELPIAIEAERGLTVMRLSAKVKRIQEDFARRGIRLALVVVDYVQLMDGSEDVEKGAKRERELAKIGERIKGLALDNPEITWVVLSQLNDDGQVRESRALEHHADNHWSVSVDKKAGGAPGREAHSARVCVKKQRGGPFPRTAAMWFHPVYTLFSDDEILRDP